MSGWDIVVCIWLGVIALICLWACCKAARMQEEDREKARCADHAGLTRRELARAARQAAYTDALREKNAGGARYDGKKAWSEWTIE